MFKKSGASSAAPGNTPKNPSGPASLTSGEAPDSLKLHPEVAAPATDHPARSWEAFGLRPTPEGYVLVRVEMKGNEVMAAVVLRQPEPQRGVAFSYLETEVAEAYLRYANQV